MLQRWVKHHEATALWDSKSGEYEHHWHKLKGIFPRVNWRSEKYFVSSVSSIARSAENQNWNDTHQYQTFFEMVQRYHKAIESVSPTLEAFVLAKILRELHDCQWQRTARVRGHYFLIDDSMTK